MVDFWSNSDDIIWLAYKLKEKLGNKISINQFGLGGPVLTGKYSDKKSLVRFEDIDFNIKYNATEFLSLNVGEIYVSRTYEEKAKTLNKISKAIYEILNEEKCDFVEPLAFYITSDGENKVPNLDWVFTKREEYAEALKNNTLFDDAIPEDLFFYDEPKEIKKEPKKYKIKK